MCVCTSCNTVYMVCVYIYRNIYCVTEYSHTITYAMMTRCSRLRRNVSHPTHLAAEYVETSHTLHTLQHLAQLDYLLPDQYTVTLRACLDDAPQSTYAV